jgi:8-oxo-dGTP diphosphatase
LLDEKDLNDMNNKTTTNAYTPIMGTLAYIFDEAQRKVLLVHRTARPHDQHLGKWNGLGGKVEAGEDLAAATRREIAEEANIQVTAMTLRGTISWPGFGIQGEDWFSLIFLITDWTGTPATSNAEGDLEWIPVSRLLDACSSEESLREKADLPMWEGDRYFIPLVFDNDQRVFHGVMPYSDGHPTSWTYERH